MKVLYKTIMSIENNKNELINFFENKKVNNKKSKQISKKKDIDLLVNEIKNNKEYNNYIYITEFVNHGVQLCKYSVNSVNVVL